MWKSNNYENTELEEEKEQVETYERVNVNNP